MAYALRAFWERDNRFGVTDRIEIQEDNFVGSTIEFGAKSEPFNFRHREITQESSEGLLNIQSNKILEGVLDFFPLVDTANKQTLINDIADSDLKQFRVAFKRDGNVMWYGYPSGRKVSRPERETYFAQLQFLDVEFLKGQTFPLEDNRQTLITTIANLLDFLDFGVDITTVTSWQEENTTVTDDFLNQVYSDTYGLRDYSTQSPITVYEALQRVCETALLVKQWNGWRVNQISGYSNPSSCLQSVYNSAGVQQSSTSVDLRQTLYTSESNGTPVVKISSARDSYPPIKKMLFRYDDRVATEELGVSEIINTSFDTNEAGTVSVTDGSDNVSGSGTSFVNDVAIGDELWCYDGDYFRIAGIVESIANNTLLVLEENVSFTSSGVNWALNTQPNQTSSVDFTSTGNQSLTYSFSVSVVGADVFGSGIDCVLPYKIKAGQYYYDVSTNTWTTTETVNRYLFQQTASSPQIVTFSEEDIALIPDGESGIDLTVYAARRDSDDTIVDESEWTVDIFEVINSSANTGTVQQYSAEQALDYREVYNYGTILYSDAIIGAATEFSSAYYRYSTDNTDYTRAWRRRGETTYRGHERLLLREIMDFQRTRTYKLRSEMWGEFDLNKIGVYEGFNFMHVGGSYNGRWNPICIDVNEQVETDSYDNIIVSNADTEASGTGGTTGGSTTSGITQAAADARYLEEANNLSDLDNASSARTNLGLVIGSDVQAWDADLDNLATGDGSNLTEVGTLNSGSITSGFGSIDIGSSSLDAGNTNINGSLSVSGASDFSNDITITNSSQPSLIIKEVGESLDTLRIFSFGNQSVLRPLEDGTLDFKFDGTKWVLEGDFNIDSGSVIIDSSNEVKLELARGTGSASIRMTNNVDDLILRAGINTEVNIDDTNQEIISTVNGVDTLTLTDLGADILGDLTVTGNTRIEGGLFAKEFVVNTTRVLTDFAMSAGGKISSSSGTAGSENILIQDENGSLFNPFAVGDIIHIQRTTGSSNQTIVKNIWRYVSSIAGNIISLGDNSDNSNLTWTAGTDDVGSIEAGDSAVRKGNLFGTTARDHYIKFDISGNGGVEAPTVTVFDNVTDVNDDGDIRLMYGKLDGKYGVGASAEEFGFAVGDSSLTDNHIVLTPSTTAFQLDTFKLNTTGLDIDSSVPSITIGTGGKLEGSNWEITETNWVHPTLGAVIYAKQEVASYGANNEAGLLTNEEWQESVTVLGSATDSSRSTKIRVRYYHKDRIQKLILNAQGRTFTDSDGTATYTNTVYLSVAGLEASQVISTTSVTEFTLELDVTTLTADTYYIIEVDVEAEVTGGAGNSGSETSQSQTYLREDAYILTSTT